VPGVTASTRAKNPYGSIELDLDGSSLSIRSKMTHQLFVVPVRQVRVQGKSLIR
jgi:hypothetical protein